MGDFADCTQGNGHRPAIEFVIDDTSVSIHVLIAHAAHSTGRDE